MLTTSLYHRNQADLIRFFAHLILFFRGLGQGNQQYNLPLEPCTKIIDAYVQILQLNEKPELVALYASQLQADNAIEAYAQFLACKHCSIRVMRHLQGRMRADPAVNPIFITTNSHQLSIRSRTTTGGAPADPGARPRLCSRRHPHHSAHHRVLLVASRARPQPALQPRRAPVGRC